ncbi:carbonic anhydrase [Granulicella tundricola]|uniref:Carbonic anhydrase n=1 Tax=Granulicella tundricola (strain ATCC BAA-1859 / DSM 23138 / MP5ACTX9) TaxID=1198114 RepID=E8WV58_GRATM|nr:carbonic anhydrase [Granulicella tundricola]ADW67233.1 carbonic anhydrase [Granulicella tundricola MP5ACTX9]
MSAIDTMLTRNKDFAAHEKSAGTLMPSLPEAMPNVKALVITCADMRVDPAHVLGVESGEAIVLRNIGGRITPGLVEQIGLLGRIGQVAGAAPAGGGEFHIVILQHTDCGITRLAGDPALLAHFFQIQESEVASKTVLDPHNAVAMDVASLRAITALPASWMISGLVYDVATGLVEVVIPPAPLRAA